MLKKTERLDRTQFNLCFTNGRRFHGLLCTIISSPTTPGFLCAVVVGKKVSKKAPVRNRIRRRVYGLVEKLRNEKPLAGAFIIIVKPEAGKLSAKDFISQLGEEVGRLMN